MSTYLEWSLEWQRLTVAGHRKPSSLKDKVEKGFFGERVDGGPATQIPPDQFHHPEHGHPHLTIQRRCRGGRRNVLPPAVQLIVVLINST